MYEHVACCSYPRNALAENTLLHSV
eukprot:COSAG02_NODE_50573_length_319_cov_1.627273_2_plen_24_part_01